MPNTPPAPWWATETQRPYLHPTQVHRSTVRGLLAVATVVSLVCGALWWVLIASQSKDVTRTESGMLAHRQSNNALIGGCGPVFRFPDPLADSGVVPARDAAGRPNRQHYTTIVPMRGPFWDTPAARRAWDRDDTRPPVAEMLMRNQWDGALVAYYSDDVPDDDVQSLLRLAKTQPELRLIVAPWEEHLRGPLPLGRELAFVTWNASQSCHALVVPAIFDFRAEAPAADAPGADGTPPPVLRATAPVVVNRS